MNQEELVALARWMAENYPFIRPIYIDSSASMGTSERYGLLVEYPDGRRDTIWDRAKWNRAEMATAQIWKACVDTGEDSDVA
ncbi:MAG: hypothetical protein NVSMB52_07740 [Chloroflexota bacterium]